MHYETGLFLNSKKFEFLRNQYLSRVCFHASSTSSRFEPETWVCTSGSEETLIWSPEAVEKWHKYSASGPKFWIETKTFPKCWKHLFLPDAVLPERAFKMNHFWVEVQDILPQIGNLTDTDLLHTWSPLTLCDAGSCKITKMTLSMSLVRVRLLQVPGKDTDLPLSLSRISFFYYLFFFSLRYHKAEQHILQCCIA